MTIDKRLAVAAVLLATVTVVLATLYGPFYVSAMGPAYMNTTFEGDRDAEFDLASKIYALYVFPQLNGNVSKLQEAKKSGIVRVVYAGGSKIVDFRITQPYITDSPYGATPEYKLISSADYQDPVLTSKAFNCTPGKSYQTMDITYATGYWGQSATIGSDGSTMTITASWVDTGFATVSSPRSSNYSTYCP